MIRFAVLVLAGGETDLTRATVRHLYLRKRDAEQCALVYNRQPGYTAIAVSFAQPIPQSRAGDLWLTFDEGTQPLLHWRTDVEATMGPAPQGIDQHYIEAPIRRGMPIQSGIPQLSPGADLT